MPRRQSEHRTTEGGDGGRGGDRDGRIERDRAGDRARARRGGLCADGRRAPAGEARGGRARSCATRATRSSVVAGNLGDEEVVRQVVAAHRERFGRLDVLVNNAGVGDRRGGRRDPDQVPRHAARRSTCARSSSSTASASDLLRAAGAEHRNALVVNTSSISGKRGQPWLSVYCATKAAVVGFTQAMHKELGGEGIKSTALCPAFVDTAMTDFVKDQVPPEEMIQRRGRRRDRAPAAEDVAGRASSPRCSSCARPRRFRPPSRARRRSRAAAPVAPRSAGRGRRGRPSGSRAASARMRSCVRLATSSSGEGPSGTPRSMRSCV